MLGGYIGKLLFVDLSERKIKEELLDEKLARGFLGGYGLGARILWDGQRAGVDPLGPENLLGFLTGPLTGTSALVGSRFVVVGKSPLTNTWGDANAGGYFGPTMKFAGVDGIFFQGTAKTPVYFLVENGRGTLRDASHLWGRDTRETESALRQELGPEVRIACIGPAGESNSLIAAIIHDGGRAAARSGLGAVMGAKRLKAVAVKGSGRVPVADEPRLTALRRKYLPTMSESMLDSLRRYGTSASVASAAELNSSPIKNWAGVGPVDFPNAGAISDNNVVKYQSKKYACYACPVGCGGIVNTSEGPFKVSGGHKPEYETLAAFGMMTLNDDVEAIIKANDICNRAGLDTISAGATVAFAIECCERGAITPNEMDGLELRWGNGSAILGFLEQMVSRKGLGAVFADGVKAAATRLGKGTDAWAVHVAGQEPGMMDPRFWPGLAAAYQLDATPGRHTQGAGWVDSLPDSWKARLGLSALTDRYNYRGKGEEFKRAACMVHVVNAAGLCLFPWYMIDPISVPEFLAAATGIDMDLEACFQIGERVAAMRQAFNTREGFNPLRHPLHGRIRGVPPLSAGTTAGVSLDMDSLVTEFVQAMGWDPWTAQPTVERLVSLGLEDVARELGQILQP